MPTTTPYLSMTEPDRGQFNWDGFINGDITILDKLASNQNQSNISFSNSLGSALAISLGGNTSGVLALISTGTAFIAGGNNVTLSQNGQSVTISAGAGGAFSAGISGGNTSGNTGTVSNQVVLAGGNNVTLSGSTNAGGMSVTVSAFNQSVQTQNLLDLSLSGNTAGALALISSGTAILAGGNNVTLSQNGQSVTISGPNTVAQSNQSLGIYASSQTTGQSSSSTYDARSLSVVGQGIVSVGWSNSSLLISATDAVQTNQTAGIYASSQTVGQSSSSTYDARSLSLVGQGIVSVGWSNSSLLVSATTPSQTNQTVGLYASSQTTAQSSSSTVDARSISIVGEGLVSVGLSAGSFIISATQSDAAQTNQTLGIYGSSQTVGQSSSSTYDARSLSLVGQGIVSVGWSNSSLLISATTPSQTNQTIGLYASSNTTGQSSSSTVDARSFSIEGLGVASVGLSNGTFLISVPSGGGAGFTAGISGGNTAGNTGTVSNELVLAGGNNITVSGSTNAGGMTVTISAFNQSNQSLGIYGSSQTTGQSSSSTYDARSLSIVGQGIVSVGWSNSSLLISATDAAQTNQTLGIYGSSQTTGQSSSSTYDARSLSVVGQGIVSVGWSNSSLLISATDAAQTNQSLGIYASSNTTGQSSSSTYDARSLSIEALGNVSVGWSNSSFLISGTQSVQTQNCVDATLAGNTAGALALISSGTMTLAGGNNITLSQAGNAVTISENVATLSLWQPSPIEIVSFNSTQYPAGSLTLYPWQVPCWVSATQIQALVSCSNSTTSNSSGGVSVTLSMAIYTLNVATLSSASSSSQTFAFTNSSTNFNAGVIGVKGFTVPININMSPGNYWFGVISSSSSSNINSMTAAPCIVAGINNLAYAGLLGNAVNSSVGALQFGGAYSTSTTAFPAHIQASEISQSNVKTYAPWILYLRAI